MEKKDVQEVKIERSFIIKKQIPDKLFNVAWMLWRNGQAVNEDNVSRTLDTLNIKVDRSTIETMVTIGEFLDVTCPVI